MAGIRNSTLRRNWGCKIASSGMPSMTGCFGRFYQFMMPFIVMPVRPWAISWPHWLAFAVACLCILGLLLGFLLSVVSPGGLPLAIGLFVVLAAIACS